MKRFFLLILCIFLILTPAYAQESAPRASVPVGYYSLGPNESPLLTIIATVDIANSAMADDFRILLEFQKDHDNEVLLIYRHDLQMPYGFIAASAAEAAGLQGKFFDAVTNIFEREREWSRLTTDEDVEQWFRDNFPSTVGGLNQERWLEDFSSPGIRNKVMGFVHPLEEASVPLDSPQVTLNKERFTEEITEGALSDALENARPAFASICVFLYEDENGNNIMEEYEYGIGGGAISVTARDGSISYTGITNGNDLVCFGDIQKGTYNISCAPPTRYNPTMNMIVSLDITQTEEIQVNFGAQLSAAALEEEAIINTGTSKNPVFALLGLGCFGFCAYLCIYNGLIKRKE